MQNRLKQLPSLSLFLLGILLFFLSLDRSAKSAQTGDISYVGRNSP